MDKLSVLAMAAATVEQSENREAIHDFHIRLGRLSDTEFLGAVEHSAAQLFRTVNLEFLAQGPTLDPVVLAAMIDTKHLWVAVDLEGTPVGFIGGENIQGNFHLVEISVAREFQGRGVGKALMKEMELSIRGEGYQFLTLTTYRDLPWNEPWYRKLGFSEVSPLLMGPRYQQIIEDEAKHGLDVSARCVMKKSL